MMNFIGIEGLDGAGKSTQIALLTKYLQDRGVEYEYLHFPRFDAPFYGDLIARFLRGEFGAVDKVDPYLVALMYAGDRRDARDTINGWLAEGKTVILDRYVYSNIAFQCAKLEGEARAVLMRWILDFEFGYNALPRPGITFFLDVPMELIENRLAAARRGDDRNYLNGAEDIHEQALWLQRRVRDVYHELAVIQSDLKVVDCSPSCGTICAPDEIFSRVMQLAADSL